MTKIDTLIFREEDHLGLYPLEQAVLKHWKSLKSVHQYLHREFERANRNYFFSKLSRPQFRIRRTWLPHGLPRGEQPLAHYDPAHKDHPAKISLFPRALLKKQDARIALIHEMIHHWEATKDDGLDPPYPSVIDRSIGQRHTDMKIEQAWRETHSARFIQKAHEIATKLGIAAEELLFKE